MDGVMRRGCVLAPGAPGGAEGVDASPMARQELVGTERVCALSVTVCSHGLQWILQCCSFALLPASMPGPLDTLPVAYWGR